jgi:hypothetical protein
MIGGLLAPLVAGFVSRPMVMRVEVMMMLGSYLCGGFVVGLLSPTVWVLEPAVGAMLAVGMTFLYAVFMPITFYGASSGKLVVAAVIAFVLAFVGADAGERLSSRLGNRSSRVYSGER